jgi:glutaredoxin
MMKVFFRTVRPLMGALILWWERTFPPRQIVVRPAEQQQKVEAELKNFALYEFLSCPFCVKVRRELKRLGIEIERRDAQADGLHRQELLNGGGKVQVPCLLITNPEIGGDPIWMYESDAIIAYLRQRFGASCSATLK